MEGPEDISPDDVITSQQIESMDRYRELLAGPPSNDKTAADLGKVIIANLLRGDKE